MARLTGLLLGLMVGCMLDATTAVESQVVQCRVTGASVQAFIEAKSKLKLDVWHHRSDGLVDVRVPLGTSLDARFGCTVAVPSLAAAVRASERSIIGEDSDNEQNWFERYHRYDALVDKLRAIARKHPKHVRLVPSIGLSVEGRSIPVVVLSPDVSASLDTKVWVNGGQHAREWASPATVMTVVNELVAHYEAAARGELGESQESAALGATEFHVAPVINPDGYEYTHTHDRLWRKNRRDNGDGTKGVDLNRNWPNHWAQGVTSQSDEEDYQGTSAASEPEVQAVIEYVSKHLPHAAAGVDYHSYGKLILRSPGWKRGNSPDEHMLKRLGEAMRVATKKAEGGSYTSEHAADLYPCTGAMDDWLSEQAGMWGHGWTVELPGVGHQFMLPEKELKRVATGAFKGLVGFTRQLHAEKRTREARAMSMQHEEASQGSKDVVVLDA